MMKSFFLLSWLLIIGCSYSVHTNSLPHLKTIKIDVFNNKTTEYTVEETIYDELINKFTNGKRLSIVNENPDCLLEGEILDYKSEFKDFSNENEKVSELKVLFNIRFTDLVKNEVIWEENTLLMKEEFSENSSELSAKTETEALINIIDDLYDKIINNTLENW